MARGDKETIVALIDDDPGADQYIPLFRAPVACTVEAAYVIMTDAVNNTDANKLYLSLKNGGTAGTATTDLAGTVGGTAGTPSWTALAPVTLTISAGSLTAGQIVTLHYDEEGTMAPGSPIFVQLEIDY
jgi:hypothetical protein